MIESEASSSTETMHIRSNVKTLCTRVQTIIRQRTRKQKRSLEIVRGPQSLPMVLANIHSQSAPFNLKYEPVSLPGLSEDE